MRRRHFPACVICWLFLVHSSVDAGKIDPLEQAREELKLAKVDTSKEALLQFFQQRAVKVDIRKIQQLVADLGSESYLDREEASKTLSQLGASSIPALLTAQRSNDSEVRRRAQTCLRVIEMKSQPRVVAAAARLLEHEKPAGTAKALLECLPTILGEDAIRAIHTTLTTLAKENKAERTEIASSLQSPLAATRAGAAVALCHAGIKTHQAKIKELLRDTDPYVRLYVGVALAQQHEREAIPVLIDLLTVLPRGKLWQVEDLLYRLAVEEAPKAPYGKTEASVKAFRDEWMKWWARAGEKLDLKARLTKPKGPLGYTLVVLLDEGKVLDLDKNNKVRFSIDKVGFPLDIEMLPGERVLLAEHGANKVTERHRDGTILWEYEISEPLVAQRLKHGQTFIGSKEQLLIVNRSGKILSSFTPPNTSETFMRARRLPNGEIICITNYSRFYRLSPTGKPLQTFSANVHTSGGRIDALPNGNVLIPEMYNDQVVEYNPHGARVGQTSVTRPIVASRLPNGHLLVTCMEDKKAVELDEKGKEVWKYQLETRVTRAVRR